MNTLQQQEARLLQNLSLVRRCAEFLARQNPDTEIQDQLTEAVNHYFSFPALPDLGWSKKYVEEARKLVLADSSEKNRRRLRSHLLDLVFAYLANEVEGADEALNEVRALGAVPPAPQEPTPVLAKRASMARVVGEHSWAVPSCDYEGTADLGELEVTEEGGRFFLYLTCNDGKARVEVQKPKGWRESFLKRLEKSGNLPDPTDENSSVNEARFLGLEPVVPYNWQPVR